jgi:hypothetical protein
MEPASAIPESGFEGMPTEPPDWQQPQLQQQHFFSVDATQKKTANTVRLSSPKRHMLNNFTMQRVNKEFEDF